MVTLPDLSHKHTNLEISRIEFERASIGYAQTSIVNSISLQIPSGSCVAVVGPNGAGKSTLFKAIVGLLPLVSGEIRVHGLSVTAHHDCIAYIPQREEVDWKFPVTVFDVIMMGRYTKQQLLRPASPKDRQAVKEALALLDIENLSNTPIGNLSGGQQQRVFLARAIAQQPNILILDEPFNGVDINTHQVILDLLTSLQKRGVTILVSTHDLNLAAQKFDLVLLINRRLIAFGTPDQVFTSENLKKAFGNQLLHVHETGTVLVDDCCPHEEEHIP